MKTGPLISKKFGKMSPVPDGGRAVKKSRFTEEQIAYALKQDELGTAVGEICRKMGIA